MILDEDQRQVRDLVRRIALERVQHRAQEIDRTAEYPHDMFGLLKELGLFGLPMPAEFGGAASMVSACLAVEELARVCYNTAYLLVVQWVPLGAIFAGGSPEQKARLLPGLASGELRGALALSEAQSGSDVSGIRTRALRSGDSYLISGAKVWCSNASLADFIVVAARVEEDGAEPRIGMFVVEAGTPGLVIGEKEDKMGARGIPSHSLFLDDVCVPVENRLGDQENGFRIVMAALNESRPIIGARAIGLAQGALDHTLAFVRERQAFGQPISDFQGVRWMLADMEIQIEASRNLVYEAALAVDRGARGKEMARLAAIAKCHASDTAMKVSTDAVQLFGASGISNEYPINRYFRDAKVLQIIEGTNQIQRNLIARILLD